MGLTFPPRLTVVFHFTSLWGKRSRDPRKRNHSPRFQSTLSIQRKYSLLCTRMTSTRGINRTAFDSTHTHYLWIIIWEISNPNDVFDLISNQIKYFVLLFCKSSWGYLTLFTSWNEVEVHSNTKSPQKSFVRCKSLLLVCTKRKLLLCLFGWPDSIPTYLGFSVELWPGRFYFLSITYALISEQTREWNFLFKVESDSLRYADDDPRNYLDTTRLFI